MPNDRSSDSVVSVTLGDAAWIRINRPHVMNALDSNAMSLLRLHLEGASTDTAVRCIVLVGEGGRAFCVGGDLKQLQADERAGRREQSEIAARHLFETLRGCAKPLIAAIDGHCLAAGFEIAILCDMIVATAPSRFGLSEVRLSLMPDAGLIELPRLLPPGEVKRLLLTGSPMTAARAFHLGLVQEVCEDRDAMFRCVEELIAEIALGAPLATVAYKRVAEASRASPEAGRELREMLWAEIGQSEDRREGVRAFIEHRKPLWRGH